MKRRDRNRVLACLFVLASLATAGRSEAFERFADGAVDQSAGEAPQRSAGDAPHRSADNAPQRSAVVPSIVVFAAASLTDALQAAGDDYGAHSGVHVTFSFAASSTLARQIENGAPADVFFSADIDWMDYLQKLALIQPATRRNLLGNRLVLIAPAASSIHLKIKPRFALAEALGNQRLAAGDPDFVPAGRYARAALESLGVWSSVSDRLVRAENVRAALAFVERGETPLGIVYASDAKIDSNVRVVDTFPDSSHPPIIYPIALTTHAGSDAAKFVEYLRSPPGVATFVKFGFYDRST